MRELATGDRVAWTESDRGIIVAADPVNLFFQRQFTVAVWNASGFSGHVTRVPGALLYRTERLRTSPSAKPNDGRA